MTQKSQSPSAATFICAAITSPKQRTNDVYVHCLMHLNPPLTLKLTVLFYSTNMDGMNEKEISKNPRAHF